ncbi:MAG: LLM class flavin-dependent oxidoreductase, partial [Mycobacterium sp.]
RLADDKLSLLLELLKGEPVVHQGRRIHATPRCLTPNGPPILIAGGSPAAARRAARFGLGFISQANSPGLKDLYESECRAHGHEPGMMQFPIEGEPTTVFVADDVDAAWAELGPHLLHDARTAAAYRHGDQTVASISRADSVAALRAAAGPYRVLGMDEAIARIRAGRSLPLLPLCGGLPPDLAWPYLERAVTATERVR